MASVLHRDDPARAPLTGNTKVTREDWLNAARDILVSDGAAEVKILPMSDRLGVSRSSFYWYFKDRSDVLAALLDEWEQRNTVSIQRHCALPAATITEAACNFFRCFVNKALFDQGLDFAVREWSRRDGAVRALIDAADDARIAAITDMYTRHGFSVAAADARARILYFMQLGYHALDQREDLDTRMGRVAEYLVGFTGQAPRPGEVEALAEYARAYLER